MLTPVQPFGTGGGTWWAKREDHAEYRGPGHPSGAKVRQYLAMIAQAPDDAILAVGCSADSAMQVYVAYAARLTGRDGYVFIPGRAVRSAATLQAEAYGAKIIEVRPGHPSVYRARCREFVQALGRPVVRWDLDYAATDTAAQVHNVSIAARRIIVPTGSGLTAAGILAAVTAGDMDVRVVAVCVSDLADKERILATANKRIGAADPDRLEVLPPTSKYGKAVHAELPDGTVLDPYYAAKALQYVLPGDVLWISGRRA